MSLSGYAGRIRGWITDKDDESRSIPFLCKSIIIMIVVGFVLRFVIGYFVTFVFDVYHWGVVIQNIRSGNGLYEITGYFYTPVWGYVLGLVSIIQDLIGVAVTGERLTDAFFLESISRNYISNITTPLFNLTLKLILFVSDLVVGYLVFWLIRDITGDARKSRIGFALWFLCPFVIVSGAVGGMFDTMSVMMTLLSIIMLRKERYLESGVMICLATLTKFFPGFLVFMFIAYIIAGNKKNGNAIRNVTVFIIGIAVTAFVILLPQLLDGTIADCFLFITSRVSEGVSNDLVGDMGGYIAIVVYVASLATSAVFAMRILKNGDAKERIFFDGMLITTAVMFLYPSLPQYILLLLPFLLFAMASDRRYLKPCLLLMVGTTAAALSSGPTDLAAIAAFTDLMGMESLMHIVDAYVSQFMGISIMNLMEYGGFVIQYIGILLILWLRFGEAIKKRVSARRHGEADDGPAL